MARWLDRAEQLTYDGEEITETVAAGAGGVVVTTHRVLVFSPAGDGAAFADVDRPNVAGVDVVEAGEGRWLRLGVQAGVVGTVLLLSGALLPLDALVGEIDFGQGAGGMGLGGAMALLETVLGVLRSLDTALLVLGALAFLVAAGALGWYLQTRERVLRIERAGDEPLTLAVGGDDVTESAVQQLRRSIAPD